LLVCRRGTYPKLYFPDPAITLSQLSLTQSRFEGRAVNMHGQVVPLG
jgi:hypothetical protein